MRADLLDHGLMTLTYTETMTMPAVVLEGLIYALTIKRRVKDDDAPTEKK